MTAVLNELGCSTVHETKKFDPVINRAVVSGCHWKPEDFKQFKTVIHQVRNPIAWLLTQSRKNPNNPTWNKGLYHGKVYEPLGKLIDETKIPDYEGAIKFLTTWLLGHEYIERNMNPIFRYKVEDMSYLSNDMKQLCNILSIEPREFQVNFTGKLGRTPGGKPWEAELKEWPEVHVMYLDKLEAVKTKAIKYGYNI